MVTALPSTVTALTTESIVRPLPSVPARSAACTWDSVLPAQPALASSDKATKTARSPTTDALRHVMLNTSSTPIVRPGEATGGAQVLPRDLAARLPHARYS